MSKVLKVTSNRGKGTSRYLPSVKKQKHGFQFILFNVCKTIIRFSFCDIQNYQGLSKSFQSQPLVSADKPLP